MRKLTCDPETEIIGQTVLSFVENIQAEELQPYLVKHGLDHITPDQWYPASRFMDLMNDMAEGTNLTSNLVAIGMAIVDKMLLPPGAENAPLSDVLIGWDDLYHFQHRNGDIGYVKTEKVCENHYKTMHHHLYPDDMVYGLAFGMARRFLPKGTRFKVAFDDGIVRRDEGGDVTVVHVNWGSDRHEK